jgi:hypothetical protein
MTGTFDFLSRECKAGDHARCVGRWQGLSIEVLCNCKCKHTPIEKKLDAEILVPLASNSDASLLEEVQYESQQYNRNRIKQRYCCD